MTIAFVDSDYAAGSGAGATVTTPSLDTTGANLIVVAVCNYGANGSVTPSDSKSNGTPNILTRYKAGVLASVQLFYWAGSLSVGSGHTFNVTGDYCPLFVAAFSGADTAPFDSGSDVGNQSGSANTLQPGSVTPSVANCVVVTGCGAFINPGVGYTVDSPFNLTDSIPASTGVTFGGGLAYVIQTSAVAANPTWNFGAGAGDCAASQAVFLPAGVAAAGRVVVPVVSRFAAHRAAGY